MGRLQEALTAPGVCTNYSHKDTLVTAVPLSGIQRSTEWRHWRRIYRLLNEGYDPHILIYAHTSLEKLQPRVWIHRAVFGLGDKKRRYRNLATQPDH